MAQTRAWKKGTRVAVYGKPFTLEEFEGRATVVKIIKFLAYVDVADNQLVRCRVRFDEDIAADSTYDEDGIFVRDVSILA